VTVKLDDGQVRTLIDAARTAAAGAYAPYSQFPVGAAVLTGDGQVIAGCNVENASYGLTVCAERVAVWTAVAAGARTVQAVAVVAPKSVGATPCGACRQVLREFAPSQGELIVIVVGKDGPVQIPLSWLLPHSFGPEHLHQT
jgi:cytidine deaminase